MSAACINDNVKSLAVLVYHGGRLDHQALSESALATAHRYRSKRVKVYINEIKRHELMNSRAGFVDVNDEVRDVIEVSICL